MTTVIIAVSCTLVGTLHDEYLDNGQEEPPAELPKMTITLTKSGNVTFGISGSGSITINWGDGSATQTYNISSGNTNLTHSGSGSRTITISGANITRLDCSDNQVTQINVSEITTLTHLFCNDNELTGLDVSANNRLAMLLCDDNRLTALNVGENTTLSFLNISFNNMQNASLNALLSSLHANNITGGKTVIISNNAGTASPQSINTAINRGWEVVETPPIQTFSKIKNQK